MNIFHFCSEKVLTSFAFLKDTFIGYIIWLLLKRTLILFKNSAVILIFISLQVNAILKSRTFLYLVSSKLQISLQTDYLCRVFGRSFTKLLFFSFQVSIIPGHSS